MAVPDKERLDTWKAGFDAAVADIRKNDEGRKHRRLKKFYGGYGREPEIGFVHLSACRCQCAVAEKMYCPPCNGAILTREEADGSR